MKAFLLLVCLMPCLIYVKAQVSTVSEDKDWKNQQVVLKNGLEAEIIIRLGDVDNLNFGWPEGYDPFCTRMTEAHEFPWEADPSDLPGFDRILLSSSYSPEKERPCGSDGYAESFNLTNSKPVTWKIPLETAKNMTVQNAWLQIFIDDFQAPSFCSVFRLFINGKRFVEGEKLLNAIDQTGPVGKLISIPLTEDFYPAISSGGNLSVLIDEATGTADGFAMDFIRLLVNRHRENSCKGTITGHVYVKDTEEPVPNATVSTADNFSVKTRTNGIFVLKDLPTGIEVLRASADGYLDGTATADIGAGNDNPQVTIYLEKGNSVSFNNQQIMVGQTITLQNIMFDQGKADIRPESKTELDKVVTFMQENTGAEIELSGHTSSEGERNLNVSLSYRRVKACKDYIVSKGIAEDRIIAIGFGPDRPLAPNDTEANRAKNRRVEMRLKKL